MQTIVISEDRDGGWRLERQNGSDRFQCPAEAYNAGLAEVERLYRNGRGAQMLLVTGRDDDARAYEAVVRMGD
ncbi:MAG: hypothetical protein JWR50_4356 [Mucilaginibacter sp.]|nr:hypothetical protein [Mucilaginibacter sp.]